MERFVSLADAQNTVTIDIGGGNKYSISRVTLKAKDMINNYIVMSTIVYTNNKLAIDNMRDEADASKGMAKMRRDLMEKAKEIRKKSEEDVKELNNFRNETIKKILEDNGYEYVPKLWEEDIDEDMPDAFIREVAGKNSSKEEKKGAS